MLFIMSRIAALFVTLQRLLIMSDSRFYIVTRYKFKIFFFLPLFTMMYLQINSLNGDLNSISKLYGYALINVYKVK